MKVVVQIAVAWAINPSKVYVLTLIVAATFNYMLPLIGHIDGDDQVKEIAVQDLVDVFVAVLRQSSDGLKR